MREITRDNRKADLEGVSDGKDNEDYSETDDNKKVSDSGYKCLS